MCPSLVCPCSVPLVTDLGVSVGVGTVRECTFQPNAAPDSSIDDNVHGNVGNRGLALVSATVHELLPLMRA